MVPMDHHGGQPHGSSWWSMVRLASKMNTTDVPWGYLQALGMFPMGFGGLSEVWGCPCCTSAASNYNVPPTAPLGR